MIEDSETGQIMWCYSLAVLFRSRDVLLLKEQL
jgi:hypothetical protein